jgi:ATP-binding protein involved in chromosome partitioning
MEVTRENVVEALKHVIHPEYENDIVTLGMVEGLEINGKEVRFSLALKKPNDPFGTSLRNACINALKTHVDKDISVVGNIELKKVAINKPDAPLSGVKNIIAVASGKGGVGKSTVAANLAVALSSQGYRVGLLDADVYGPSMPKMFNVEGSRPPLEKVEGKDKIIPVEQYGVRILSVGFFVDPKDALVWRGPMATSALKQLINDGNWGELDFLIIDLPPGTGDVHLTLVQTVSVTGAVIVSTPQEVALADAVKGISMFTGDKINVPVLGLVENMAWFTPAELPENKYYIFGREGCKKLAEDEGIPLLGQIPLVQSIREGGDDGKPVALKKDDPAGAAFLELAAETVKAVNLRNARQAPTKIVEIKNN